MDKLIELLKRHENRIYSIYGTHLYKWSLGGEIGEIHCINQLNNKEITYSELELVLISKEYGFIKWLVDNDKIDFDKVMKMGRPCFVRYDKGEIICVHDVDFDRQLIMLLSIQDNPISLLLDCLK